MLASLYSGQAMSSIHSEVLPLLHGGKCVGQLATAQERGERREETDTEGNIWEPHSSR